MILAGYIIKDKKIFSNFTAPLSLTDKTTLSRLKKFKPSKKLFESSLDESLLIPYEDAPRGYLTSWVTSSTKSKSNVNLNREGSGQVLFPNLSLISHRFMLYNNEFILVFVLKENMVCSSSLQTKANINSNTSQKVTYNESNDKKNQKNDGNSVVINMPNEYPQKVFNSDSFESLKSSPENLSKPMEKEIVLESLYDFHDDPLAQFPSKNNQKSSEKRSVQKDDKENEESIKKGEENQERIKEVLNRLKSEIVKHFFIHLEKGDAALHFTQFLHRVSVGNFYLS